MERLLIGLICSLIIIFLGFKKGMLSTGGSIAAIVLGTCVYYFGGIFLSAIMVTFFLSSSILTSFKKGLKLNLKEVHEKEGKRDVFQVAANGAFGIIYGGLFYYTGNKVFMLGYAVLFAAAASDTWASEIGVLSKLEPKSIIDFKPMERGLSGGISILGIAASIFGAGFISIVFLIFYLLIYGISVESLILFAFVAVFGFSGSIIDSLLGALLQGKYRCKICGKHTEKRTHHGEATELISGIRIINNDVVNIVSTFVASILAIITYIFI